MQSYLGLLLSSNECYCIQKISFSICILSRTMSMNQFHKSNKFLFQDYPSEIVYFVPIYLHREDMSEDLRCKVFLDSFWAAINVPAYKRFTSVLVYFLEHRKWLYSTRAIISFLRCPIRNCVFCARLPTSWGHGWRSEMQSFLGLLLSINEYFCIKKIHFCICILSIT